MAAFTDIDVEELVAALPKLEVPKASPAVAQARVVIVGGSIGGLTTAACLQAAGFENVKVFELRSTFDIGAGLGVDDASLSILKGLGVLGDGGTMSKGSLQRMRWTEDRETTGRVLVRQPYPYCATFYKALQTSLKGVLPKDMVHYSKMVSSAEQLPGGSVRIHFDGEGAEPVECDLLIAADGSRSIFRDIVSPGSSSSDAMRFAYSAWRGMITQDELPPQILATLKQAYPDFSNCLYQIIPTVPGKSAVLYDVGDGLVNWMIYEAGDDPVAPPGKTTVEASPEAIEDLRSNAKSMWGEALGGVIAATQKLFRNDIYDLLDPLSTYFEGGVVLVGDAAHASTPHMGKGSNMAMHDAIMLATAACNATNLQDMLQEYTCARAPECTRCVLVARHMGRVRTGLLRNPDRVTRDGFAFEAALKNQGLSLRTIPIGVPFDPVWAFMKARLPEAERGHLLKIAECWSMRGPKHEADDGAKTPAELVHSTESKHEKRALAVSAGR